MTKEFAFVMLSTASQITERKVLLKISNCGWLFSLNPIFSLATIL
jgi:hypothetical protein